LNILSQKNYVIKIIENILKKCYLLMPYDEGFL